MGGFHRGEGPGAEILIPAGLPGSGGAGGRRRAEITEITGLGAAGGRGAGEARGVLEIRRGGAWSQKC